MQANEMGAGKAKSANQSKVNSKNQNGENSLNGSKSKGSKKQSQSSHNSKITDFLRPSNQQSKSKGKKRTYDEMMSGASENGGTGGPLVLDSHESEGDGNQAGDDRR